MTRRQHTRHPLDPTTERIRAGVIEAIQVQLAEGGWTQRQAAAICGITQPRISDLLRGNTARFSLDALVGFTAALARQMRVQGGEAMEDVFEAGQRQVAEFMAKLATRPVSARYPVATESSITARGGRVTASSPYSTTGGRVALVGDTVCYADGTEARIVSGAGAVLGHQGRPVALVGSALDNGDTIEGPLHEGMVIVQYADVPPIEGLLDPNYVSSRSHGGQP
ncbi:XRE family transcriptional regulator [Burkholderia cenocepacia]|uniref:XRE family transcriptional regulator n=1 Tax=Burkholderia cenocepacia TaxID=95486 RepID=UPI0024B63E1F|nr:XRE family transcriptional regulator [Burkholderia cenocepacia]MDI9689711.1 XRE family transcriptional regulator [Burkholderia cenocepacia]